MCGRDKNGASGKCRVAIFKSNWNMREIYIVTAPVSAVFLLLLARRLAQNELKLAPYPYSWLAVNEYSCQAE